MVCAKHFLIFFILIATISYVTCKHKSLWIAPGRSKSNGSFDDVIPKILFTGNDAKYNSFLARNSPDAGPIDIHPWPYKTIPYKLDKSYIKFEKNLIREAMNEIQYYSCVKFVEWKEGDTDYLNIRNLENCASHIGFQTGRQTLALSSKICMKRGIIIHELMHALGFIHEHCRVDRDDYVEIHEENIFPEHLYNFKKYAKGSLEYFDDEYDYDSIMHYDRFAFSIDENSPVMTAKKPNANLDIREHLSSNDVIRLNELYLC